MPLSRAIALHLISFENNRIFYSMESVGNVGNNRFENAKMNIRIHELFKMVATTICFYLIWFAMIRYVLTTGVHIYTLV
jgi:hypothetical protein